MPNIQSRKGKRGTSYRVEFMRCGKRISKTFPNRKDAEVFAAKAALNDDSVLALAHVTLNTMTLAAAIDEYLEQHTGRDKSVPQRLSFWRGRLGSLTLAKVSKDKVRQALKALELEGKQDATNNRYKAALSAVFKYLNDNYDVAQNPCREIRQRKEDNARDRYLSDDERVRLLDACKASRWDRLYLLVLMALTTGARKGELLGLRWSDIELGCSDTGPIASLRTTKNGHPRLLPLVSDVVTLLKPLRQVGNGYIFCHPHKLNSPFEHFDHHWHAALRHADIANFRFHDLRHTAASLLARNGCTLLEIAEVLGHKSITMTQRYAHLCTGHKTQMINRVMGNIARSS